MKAYNGDVFSLFASFLPNILIFDIWRSLNLVLRADTEPLFQSSSQKPTLAQGMELILNDKKFQRPC